MDHWNARFGADIHAVDYDALVADPRREIEPLLGFLACEWEDACLTPETDACGANGKQLASAQAPPSALVGTVEQLCGAARRGSAAPGGRWPVEGLRLAVLNLIHASNEVLFPLGEVRIPDVEDKTMRSSSLGFIASCSIVSSKAKASPSTHSRVSPPTRNQQPGGTKGANG